MGSSTQDGASGSENVLRRRMNILERAASKAGEHSYIRPRSQSRSSLEDYSDDSTEPSTAPASPNTLSHSFIPATTRRTRSRSQSDSQAIAQTSWYQFDLAVLAALVSPLGHLLTGGDHVKNLLFIMLLIYYLHQVIEVPWNLYVSALPRKSVHSDAIETNPLAVNALQRLELAFLTLALLSPLAGGALLHYVAPLITGSDPSSFFSTGLFVLATAVRPWRHLVQRLSSRTTELHNAIHYPPSMPSNGKERSDSSLVEVEELRAAVAHFGKVLGKLRQRVGDEFDELYENLETVEMFANRQEKKMEKIDHRLKHIETTVVHVAQRTTPGHWIQSAIPKPFLSFLLYFFPNHIPPGPREVTQVDTKSSKRRTNRAGAGSGLATIPEEDPPTTTEPSSYEGLPVPSSDYPSHPYRHVQTPQKQVSLDLGEKLILILTYPVTATSRLLFGGYN